MPNLPSIAALVAALAVCFVIALIGARVTAPEIPTWYAGLAKPSWTPPRIAFPIVWPVLYVLMAVAVWLIWRAPPSGLRSFALVAFALQLALNAIWSPLFFGQHNISGGLVVIALLVIALVATIALAFRIDWLPGALLIPYLVWTSFATALNFRIWTLN